MKKVLLLLLALALLSGFACAENARDYALWLEEALPGAAFIDGEIPAFITEMLGRDYNFIAREDAQYGGYIAGVRRSDAPALPEGAHQTAYEGTFETRVFQAADAGGNILYEFALAQDVYMCAYDDLKHLVIWIDPDGGGVFSPPDTQIFAAADENNRARMQYSARMGFHPQDESRSQLCFYIHDVQSWQAGATKEPAAFYLDMTPPENILGSRYLEEEQLIQYARIPIGLYLKDGTREYALVQSQNGMLGVETHEPHRLYEAGSGCGALLDLAEKVLGYRPGEMDFAQKQSIRAELIWQTGSAVLEDASRLARLDKLFSAADFTVGNVNCPSPCFLRMDYADGSHADFAVAVNSFDLFFRNGLFFTTEEDIIGLFDLQDTDLYKNIFGG